MDSRFEEQKSVGFMLRLIAAALLALVAMLYVAVLNGRPLYYFDSIMYLNKGTDALRMVLPKTDIQSWSGSAAAPANPLDDGVVSGTRFTVYALTLAMVNWFASLKLFPLVNALVVAAAVWLAATATTKNLPNPPDRIYVVALPIIVASAGTLPFYIAFLMPDIFAAIMILVSATVCVYGRSMSRGQWLLAFSLGAFAALSHPSHPPILAALVPVAAVIGLIATRRFWWMGALFLVMLFAAAMVERSLFKDAVKSVAKSEVEFFPFITVRLIADGPGYAYLTAHCPDSAIQTCKLFAALQQSDDPKRLTATHIMFEKSERLGSYNRMSLDDRLDVGGEELRFAKAVTKEYPVEVASTLLRNTWRQAWKNSVQMTLADERTVAAMEKEIPGFGAGRLVENRSWLAVADLLHSALAGLSLIVLLGLTSCLGQLPRDQRLLAIFVLLGILANAFVCGGVSQPADRYGARVIWLLPALATMLGLCAFAARNQKGRISK